MLKDTFTHCRLESLKSNDWYEDSSDQISHGGWVYFKIIISTMMMIICLLIQNSLVDDHIERRNDHVVAPWFMSQFWMYKCECKKQFIDNKRMGDSDNFIIFIVQTCVHREYILSVNFSQNDTMIMMWGMKMDIQFTKG